MVSHGFILLVLLLVVTTSTWNLVYSFSIIITHQHFSTQRTTVVSSIVSNKHFLSTTLRKSSNNDISETNVATTTDSNNTLDPDVASQFKILTCSSTSCSKQMKVLGLDEYALFSGLYERKENAKVSQVQIEESSCLGCCKVGPCVGIEHEDYYGTVALEGMKSNEFKDRVFQK